jgi:rhamnose utilization protein RhaD (predicted bifunctional aldolase and dehydrogenase)
VQADSAFVPYVEPGSPVGIAVHKSVVDFQETYNIPPLVIMLKNHGMVVYGQSTTFTTGQMSVTTGRS